MFQSLLGNAIGAVPQVTVTQRPLASPSAPNGAVFIIQRNSITNEALTVNYTLAGTALNGVDYVKLTGSAYMGARESYVPIVVEPIARTGIQTNLTVILAVQSSSSYQLGSPSSVVGLIQYQDFISNAPIKLAITATPMKVSDYTRYWITATGSETYTWMRQVEFFEGNSLLGIVTQAIPPSTTLESVKLLWPGVRPGNYYLSVRATDQLGLVSTSKVMRLTVPAVPTLTITNPVANATFTQSQDIEIDAIALDPDGFIYDLNFYDGVSSKLIGTSSIATLVAPPHGTPAYHHLVWKNASVGAHYIYVEANLASGVKKRTETTPIRVLTNPLSVIITTPANNATFYGSTNVTISANSNSKGVPAQKVDFYANGNFIGQATNNPIYSSLHPYTITWSNAPVGKYLLTAKATDYQGLTATSAPVSISILQPKLPIINIVATDPYASNVTTNSGGVTLIDTGTFTVYRGGNTNGTVSVYLLVSGTAMQQVDFQYFSPWITFGPGVLQSNIVVMPLNRGKGYKDTYVSLKLMSGSYNMGTSAAAVVYIKDNIRTSNAPPTVSWNSPSYGQFFPSPTPISFRINANDSDGWIQKVEIYNRSNLFATITNSFTNSTENKTYSFVWTNPPCNTYDFQAVAYDNRGAKAQAGPRNITVSSRTNYLAITSPTNNSSVAAHAALTIEAVAVDPSGYPTRVEFFDGSTKLGESVITAQIVPRTGTPAKHSMVWSNVPSGDHALLARSTYASGTSVMSSPAFISTFNPIGQLVITQPTNGSIFSTLTQIPIQAAASDPNGYIASVVFFANGSKIGQSQLVFGSPGGFPLPGTVLQHSMVWSNPPAGDYILTAKAIDTLGNTILSPEVKILVADSGPANTVTRTLPGAYQPGQTFTVRLSAQPSATTQAWSVEDQPPAGWVISAASDSGTIDTVNRKVKFGPFFDAQARELTYLVTPPIGESGAKFFAGTYSFDGGTATILGPSLLSNGVLTTHPADNSPNDFTLTMAEVTAYAEAWRRGTIWPVAPNPIPASYVARAAALWRGGELYSYDASQSAPLCWVNPTATKNSMRLTGGTAIRTLTAAKNSGAPISVTIHLQVAASTLASVIEDQPPTGWIVDAINEGGAWDSTSGKVKWGPFYDTQARTLTYTVIPGTTGNNGFVGQASFDGMSIAIKGPSTEKGSNRATISRLENGTLQVEWSGDFGVAYTLERSTNLSDWLPVATFTNQVDAAPWVVPDSQAEGMLFYRLMPVK